MIPSSSAPYPAPEVKRSLTSDEIKYILSFIKPLPGLLPEIGQAIADRHFENHAKQLRSIQLYPSKIPEMRARLERLFFKSQIEPGKAIGSTTSSSIGEKNTQISLSSKHTTGQNKVELLEGVPRLEELINITRDIKTPSMEIHLLSAVSPTGSLDLSCVQRIAQEQFEYKELNDFLLDYEFKEDRELGEEEQTWYEFHRIFYGNDFEIGTSSWSVRLIFDTTKLFYARKSLSSLVEAIESNYADAFCVPSPDIMGIIDVYIRTDSLGDVDTIIESITTTRKKGKKGLEDPAKTEGPKKETKKKEQDKAEDLCGLINDANKEKYFIRDLVIPSIRYIHVSGIEQIKKCYYQEGKDRNWYITTKGSNLRAIINHPLVDPIKVSSNHLWDNYEVFGIHAAKAYLNMELQKVITISNRHIDLLIHCMTHSGKLQAASRYGIDIKQVGLWAKVAFEQPWDNFFLSADLAESEEMTGVSAAIAAGNPPLVGSGYMELRDKENPEEVIIEEQCSYKFDNQFINQLESEQRAFVKNRQPRLLMPSNLESTSLNNYRSNYQKPALVSQPKRSTINASIKPALFTPDLPIHLREGGKPVSTVTRIILNNPGTKAEITQLRGAPPSLFKNDKVIEHETENSELEMY